MNNIRGYWSTYSYVVILEEHENDEIKTMEFVSEDEAIEYFKEKN